MSWGIPIADDDPRRAEVRAWIADHPAPSARALAEAGYVAPNWPPPWGLGADAMEQLIIEEELARAGIQLPLNPLGMLFVGPALLTAGTAAQQRRFLPGLLAADEMWCRMYSEPDAGSDLSCVRTAAVRDGDVFRVDGQKLWAPLANSAPWGAVVVRTSGQPGDRSGLTYLLCRMDSPGISVRPIRDASGASIFNEIFFDDAAIPVDQMVGDEGAGFPLLTARVTPPKVTISQGIRSGRGPTVHDLLRWRHSRSAPLSPALLDHLVRAVTNGELLRLLALRIAAIGTGHPQARTVELVRRVAAERHAKDVANLAMAIAGPTGTAGGTEDFAPWLAAFLNSPTFTIVAGAVEVHLDELAESGLGL